MFSLLVSPDPDHWKAERVRFDKSRFLEGTSNTLKVRFRNEVTRGLTNLKDLEAVPALLGYEKSVGAPFELGWLTDIAHDDNGITFGVIFDDQYDPVPAAMLAKHQHTLEIDLGEFTRYHWAVKASNLQRWMQEMKLQRVSKRPPPLPVTPNKPRLGRLGRSALIEEHAASKDRAERPDWYLPVLEGGHLLVAQSEPQALKPPAPATEPALTSTMAIEAATTTKRRPRVFVVHGRDEGMKNNVSLFLERIGIEAVILHEQANGGRTVITKFIETAKGCDFAVALLAPEDVGELKGVTPQKERARQNVVLELGFFLGLLGPAKVVALMSGHVERPSDLEGVVYVKYDGAGWKTELARELDSSGIEFDHKAMLRV